jgi:hypothetical protein
MHAHNAIAQQISVQRSWPLLHQVNRPSTPRLAQRPLHATILETPVMLLLQQQ